MRSNLSILFVSSAFIIMGYAMISCSEEHEHMAPAIRDRDSVPVMTTYGVNTLISDSGVIKYRIVTEQWEVNENKKPSRWIFNKGILLTQFNLKKHVVGYIQCDTAVYYDQDRRWEGWGIFSNDKMFSGSNLGNMPIDTGHVDSLKGSVIKRR